MKERTNSLARTVIIIKLKDTLLTKIKNLNTEKSVYWSWPLITSEILLAQNKSQLNYEWILFEYLI